LGKFEKFAHPSASRRYPGITRLTTTATIIYSGDVALLTLSFEEFPSMTVMSLFWFCSRWCHTIETFCCCYP